MEPIKFDQDLVEMLKPYNWSTEFMQEVDRIIEQAMSEILHGTELDAPVKYDSIMPVGFPSPDKPLIPHIRSTSYDKETGDLCVTVASPAPRYISTGAEFTYPLTGAEKCQIGDKVCDAKGNWYVVTGVCSTHLTVDPDPGDVDTKRPISARERSDEIEREIAARRERWHHEHVQTLGGSAPRLAFYHVQSSKPLLYSVDVFKSLKDGEFIAVSSFPIKASAGSDSYQMKPYACGTTPADAQSKLADSVRAYSGRKELGVINVHFMLDRFLCVHCSNGSTHATKQDLLNHLRDYHDNNLSHDAYTTPTVTDKWLKLP